MRLWVALRVFCDLDTLPAVSLCRVLLLVFVGVVPWCYSVRTFYLSVCRGLCLSDGEPVSLCRGVGRSACGCGLVAAGMCCLWWSVPSVLGVGVGWCACGCVAVVGWVVCL